MGNGGVDAVTPSIYIHVYAVKRNFSNIVMRMGYFSSATQWQQTITTLSTIWFSNRVYMRCVMFCFVLFCCICVSVYICTTSDNFSYSFAQNIKSSLESNALQIRLLFC